MAEYIGAPIVDVQTVHDAAGAAAYVAKYISKAPVRYDGCKRYWRSQGWCASWIEHWEGPDLTNRHWGFAVEPAAMVMLTYRDCGWSADWETDSTWTARAGPGAISPPLLSMKDHLQERRACNSE